MLPMRCSSRGICYHFEDSDPEKNARRARLGRLGDCTDSRNPIRKDLRVVLRRPAKYASIRGRHCAVQGNDG